VDKQQALAPVRAAIIARQEVRTQAELLAEILAREEHAPHAEDDDCRLCRLEVAADLLTRARAYLSQAITQMYPRQAR
jgi:hypothetical protein